ncbi:MAG: hypothetical protein ACLQU3_32755 [Limisphaerales bacterium]
MIPLDKLQEMSKEELIQAFLGLQQEYARQNQLYLNLTNENAAIAAAVQEERNRLAALQQERANLQNAYSAQTEENKKLKAAHTQLQNQRFKRKWFSKLFQ